MEMTQEKMRKTYEEVIDNNIEQIKTMQKKGLSTDEDLLLVDTCIKYAIFMSETRTNENH